MIGAGPTLHDRAELSPDATAVSGDPSATPQVSAIYAANLS